MEWKEETDFAECAKKKKDKLLCITVLMKKVNEKEFGIKYDLGNSSPGK